MGLETRSKIKLPNNSQLDSMISPFRSKVFPCQMLACLTLTFPRPGFTQNYTITDLNDPSDSYRLAYGMNSAGDVVGEYEAANVIYVHAFWYGHNAWLTFTNLPGNGSVVTVTDSTPTNSERYYRVVAH